MSQIHVGGAFLLPPHFKNKNKEYNKYRILDSMENPPLMGSYFLISHCLAQTETNPEMLLLRNREQPRNCMRRER